MQKEFIPYEQALELKKLGFNEECSATYRWWCDVDSFFNHIETVRFHIVEQNGLDWDTEKNESFKKYDKDCTAPLYQQAFRWLREKFNFHYFIERDGDVYNAVCDACLIVVCNTYEQAEQVCLLRLIDLAKQVNK